MMSLLLLSVSLAAASPCHLVHGGIAEGMCLTQMPSSPGRYVIPLGPAPQAGPPLDPRTVAVLDPLLAAYDKRSTIPGAIVADGAWQKFCATIGPDCFGLNPLDVWRLGNGFHHNAPYLLEDGRIRIEWMSDGTLQYVSVITLFQGKVAQVDTAPAVIPMLISP